MKTYSFTFNRSASRVRCVTVLSLCLVVMLLLGNVSARAAQMASPQPPASPFFDPNDPVDANDPDFMTTFNKQYASTWGTSAIPEKYKQLTGITLSVSLRCDACLTFHIKMALKQKATKAEIVESFRLGLLSAGSATIPTIRKGYATLKELGADVAGAK